MRFNDKKRIIFLIIFLFSGCQNAWHDEQVLWTQRLTSIHDGKINIGMPLKNFQEIWGKADDSTLSVFSGHVLLTLTYENHLGSDGLYYDFPLKTYFFDFDNNKLTSWHEI